MRFNEIPGIEIEKEGSKGKDGIPGIGMAGMGNLSFKSNPGIDTENDGNVGIGGIPGIGIEGKGNLKLQFDTRITIQ